MITYRPSSRAGAPAFDDTPIRERLDVLEENRSASPAFRPELRSRVGGLTLDSDIYDLIPSGGILTFRIQTPDGSEIRADAYGGPISIFLEDIAGDDSEGFLETFIDDSGYLVIRPVDPTEPLHVTTAMPDTVISTFAGIDDTWFGQDVFPRPAGTYDTTSGAVRLTGPTGAYAPGSGLSVSTALEALKRLHHARDLVVEDRQFWSVPDDLDPATVTLGQIGAELGQTAALSWASQENVGVYGDPISVNDLTETVVSFLGRIPGVGFAYVEKNGPGRSVIAFYTSNVPWELTTPNRDGYGFVRIEFDGFAGFYPHIRRILTRAHSDDLYVYSNFADAGTPFLEAASGQLSTVLGSVMTELRWLRHRASNAELVAKPEDFGADASVDADHTDAIRRAAAKAIATGCPLVLSRGRYRISQPLVVTTGLHVIIEGGATLAPRPGFVGQSLVVVGERNRVAEFWSITGAGTIDCSNAVEIGIDVVLGRFANVAIPAIRGATRHGVRIGDDAAEFSSYEVDIEALRVYRDHHANAANSIGIYHRNATDCYVSRSYSIGYRKGFRTERGSISHSKCHAWVRPIHGPMTHAFDLAGGAGVAVDCYADTPTNYGDSAITEVFGFLLSGSGTTLIAPKVFNNPSLTPDISTDGVITPFHVAAGCDAHVVTPRLLGGTANRRFRTLVSGDRSRLTLTGFNRLPLTQFVDQESANYDDRIGNALSVSQSLTVTGGAFFLGRTQFFGPAQARSYTVAQLPAASQFTHGIVQVSNGNAGQPCLAISDGTAWRRIPLGAAVATS